MSSRVIRSLSFLTSASLLSLAFTGCATSLESAVPSTATPAVAGGFGGKVHGGQQPVYNATVRLFAAGTTTGYGSTPVLLGTTTTDPFGTFNFNVAGVSPCVTGQNLYIVATGGDSGTGPNSASAMMAALPQACNAGTGATMVWINELSTVAAVWSLQQFMTITPGAVIPWAIGAPSTNVTGQANAFAGTAQMVGLSTGVSAASTVTNTVSGVTYSTVITPDVNRMNTLGDILASCINSNGGATSMCAQLLADATPSGATAPTDTLQAAYYLATNAAGLTMNAHGNANGAPAYQCSTYVTANSPFQPTLDCTNGALVSDWMQSIAWRTTYPNGAGTTTTGTVATSSLAIDSVGNIWTGPGSTVTTNIINQFNPTGQMLITPVSSIAIPAYNINFVAGATTTPEAYPGSTVTLGGGRGNSLAIDTNNNAFFASSYATAQASLVSGGITLPIGVIAQVAPGGAATGFLSGVTPSAVVIDGSNNLWVGDSPTASRYYISELLSAGGYTTLNEGFGRGTGIYAYILVNDPANQYIAGFTPGNATCTNIGIPKGNSAAAVSGTASVVVTVPANCLGLGASDAATNVWASTNGAVGAGNLIYINSSASAATPTVTTFTGTTQAVATGVAGTGGLDNPSGVAIDGLGKVWVANRVSSTTLSGVSAFKPTTDPVSLVTTAVPLSPGGTVAGQFGFQVFGAPSISNLVIDGSGNLWLTNTAGSSLYHMVGAAAPVVTPTSSAFGNSKIATRP